MGGHCHLIHIQVNCEYSILTFIYVHPKHFFAMCPVLKVRFTSSVYTSSIADFMTVTNS